MAARADELTRRAAPRGGPRRLLGGLRRVPTAAWICALVAFLNAAAWSLITPPFQVPDEQSHYAYTEYLVQHGQPPIHEETNSYSGSLTLALRDLRFQTTQFVPANHPIWSAQERERLLSDLRADDDRAGGNGGAKEVGSEPPLFYALQAIPYKLAEGGTVLDRLALMRLLSALLAGATVLFTFLFLREALPAAPHAWTVGALGVAFLPLFAFVSSGVNSDALLYAASAALFYALARGFRRGLTAPLAAATGAAMAVGLMTKFNFFGLAPGAAVALLAIAIRDERGLRLRTLRLPALALGVAVAPVLLEMALNAAVWDRPTVGATSSNFASSELQLSLGGSLSYLWQFYLIPLPGQEAPIGGLPPWESWYHGFVGLFGWIDTEFDASVYRAGLVPAAAIAALAAAALVTARRALWRRRVELAMYALIAVGLAGFVGVASYIIYTRLHQSVAQARYLLPLVPLYGGLLALAARGAGARLAPVAGTAIVALAIAHSVFSQLLVIARYYA